MLQAGVSALNTAAQNPDRVEAVVEVKVGDRNRSKAGTDQWQGRPPKPISTRPRLTLHKGKPGYDGPKQRPERAGAAWPKSGTKRRRPQDSHRGPKRQGENTRFFSEQARRDKPGGTRGKACNKQNLLKTRTQRPPFAILWPAIAFAISAEAEFALREWSERRSA